MRAPFIPINLGVRWAQGRKAICKFFSLFFHYSNLVNSFIAFSFPDQMRSVVAVNGGIFRTINKANGAFSSKEKMNRFCLLRLTFFDDRSPKNVKHFDDINVTGA